MNGEQFDAVVSGVLAEIADTLQAKNSAYNPNEDKLATFKHAAAVQGVTPLQALFGMQTKHLVSVSNMISSGKEYSDELWTEKIGDSTVYFILMRALLAETPEEDFSVESAAEIPSGTPVFNIHNSWDGTKSGPTHLATD